VNEIVQEGFSGGGRRKTPRYKNKLVATVSRRISDAKGISRVYRLLALAGRELEADMLGLDVLLNIKEGRSGVIRFAWSSKDYNPNGPPLWTTRYPLSREEVFSGTLTYGKAEWKKRRRSEEDEIWVMDLGKALYDWLDRAVKEGKIDPEDLDSPAVVKEVVSVYPQGYPALR